MFLFFICREKSVFDDARAVFRFHWIYLRPDAFYVPITYLIDINIIWIEEYYFISFFFKNRIALFRKFQSTYYF